MLNYLKGVPKRPPQLSIMSQSDVRAFVKYPEEVAKIEEIWNIFYQKSLFFAEKKNPRCQSICHQKDNCPGHAGCGPVNGKCIPA